MPLIFVYSPPGQREEVTATCQSGVMYCDEQTYADATQWNLNALSSLRDVAGDLTMSGSCVTSARQKARDTLCTAWALM